MRAFVFVVWLLTGCAGAQRYQFEEAAMGTSFQLVFYGDGPAAAKVAARAAFSRIHELDALLSDYKPSSEISRLSGASAAAPGAARKVSTELARVLRSAEEVSRATSGAFDVTVGPLVRLWRRAARQGQLPDAQAIEQAGLSVGWNLVELSVEGGADVVTLLGSNMKLDLGGIAKGFALDEAARVLGEHGVTRALVNGGGDVIATGPPPGSAGWRVGLDAGGGNVGLVLLQHGACATSGDSFRYVQVDGVRYSHVVDPRTGCGLTSRQAATVLAPTGMLADAWASALCVLSPQDGLALVDRLEGVEARVWQKEGKLPCDSVGFLVRMRARLPSTRPRLYP